MQNFGADVAKLHKYNFQSTSGSESTQVPDSIHQWINLKFNQFQSMFLQQPITMRYLLYYYEAYKSQFLVECKQMLQQMKAERDLEIQKQEERNKQMEKEQQELQMKKEKVKQHRRKQIEREKERQQ